MELSKEERAAFIENNMNLVYSTIHKKFSGKRRGNFEFCDLVSIGAIGLIKAVDGFDPQYGCEFSTYAVPKIAGEILREVRNFQDIIHFSRTIKELYNRILKSNLQHCTPAQISKILDVDEKLVIKVFEFEQVRIVDSMDKEIGEDGGMDYYEKVAVYQPDFDAALIIDDLDKILNQNEKEALKLILSGKTQCEIAKRMYTSQPVISRLQAKIRRKIRKYLISDELYA